MELNTLKPKKGSRHARKRVGRGQGSGHGKMSSRGLSFPQPAIVGLAESETLAQSTAVAAPAGEALHEAPDISVVLPIFNEQENVPDLYQRLSAVLGDQGLDYELIFVDGGSRDQSLALLENLAAQDVRVKVLQLARNFGHHVAISAGLDYARGRGVIVMDADLQDPPEVLPQFIAKWREGYDVVYAIRGERQENWLKRLAYVRLYPEPTVLERYMDALFARARYESEPNEYALKGAHVGWVLSKGREVADLHSPGMWSLDAPLCLPVRSARQIPFWTLPTNH